MDRQEMEQTAQQYAGMIYRIALNDTHCVQDAQDLLQEVLLARFVSHVQFESPEHEKRWLIRVTPNKGKNHRRFLLRHSALPLEEARPWQSPEPECQAPRDAVAALPRKWRRVIDLHYYEGYSTGEIAALLQVKEATVRTWLHRGTAEAERMFKGGLGL